MVVVGTCQDGSVDAAEFIEGQKVFEEHIIDIFWPPFNQIDIIALSILVKFKDHINTKDD
jgi:hypothetical protein